MINLSFRRRKSCSWMIWKLKLWNTMFVTKITLKWSVWKVGQQKTGHLLVKPLPWRQSLALKAYNTNTQQWMWKNKYNDSVFVKIKANKDPVKG